MQVPHKEFRDGSQFQTAIGLGQIISMHVKIFLSGRYILVPTSPPTTSFTTNLVPEPVMHDSIVFVTMYLALLRTEKEAYSIALAKVE
jgi:hypothetical protein